MAVEYRIIGADGREYGPATLVELSEWIDDGRVGHGTMIWRSDDQRWLRATERSELRWDLPAPPELGQTEVPPTVQVIYPAGFGVRFAAYSIDWVITFTMSRLLLWPWDKEITDATKLTSQYADMFWKDPASLPMPTETLPPMLTIMASLIAIAAMSLTYYVGFNGRYGRTPGKFLLGLKIINQDGSDLNYRQAFARYAAELLSVMSFGYGYLRIMLTPTHEALHDLVAKTRVIHLPPQTDEDFES
ncbi:MAG TPA: RDD family protein [Candidatus Limnocylindria bacterium]|jgi:uncharacterized RDD family membrane protein YckC|nr:RDD family protein [Candidatus Limnocylindria bacterium]